MYNIKRLEKINHTNRNVWYLLFVGVFSLLGVSIIGDILYGGGSVPLNVSISCFLVGGFIFFIWQYKAETEKKWLKKRSQDIFTLASANKTVVYGKKSPLSVGEAMMKLGRRDNKYENVVSGDDWMYLDYSYGVYRKTRHGEYLVETIYYAVGVFNLPRVLPHVFFDSKAARKRQFKFSFENKQKHSLEGNFDDYFATYFPNNYTVDSLSFISPEVMQVMIEAQEYDIEISGSKLYIYGYIKPASTQLNEVYSLGSTIRKKLLNNIITYRDERIEYVDGRKTVAPIGMSLNKNLTREYLSLLFGLGLLVAVGLALTFGDTFLFYGLIMSVIIIYISSKEISRELKNRKRMHQLHVQGMQKNSYY